MEVERCPTGIDGLDELIEGGFPRGRCMLLAGGCGTGKSILATQFLHNGIVKYDEPGILICLEQNPSLVIKDMKVMGLDIEKLEAKKKLVIIDASLSDMAFEERNSEFVLSRTASFSLDSILGMIENASKKIGAKRAVVDSFSALDSLIEMKKQHAGSAMADDTRRIILGINYKLQSMGLTSILITDILEGDSTSQSRIEEFIVDGVITMHYNVSGADVGRHLIIKKMRSTKHSENINSIEFVRGEGVRVKGY